MIGDRHGEDQGRRYTRSDGSAGSEAMDMGHGGGVGGENGKGVAQGMASRDVGGRKHGTVREVKKHQGSEGF